MQITSVPTDVLPLDQVVAIQNGTDFVVAAYGRRKDTQVVEQIPGSWVVNARDPAGYNFGASSATYDIWWISEYLNPKMPPGYGCSWAQTIEVRGILQNGEAYTIGTLSAPFQTGNIEGFSLPETSPFNRLKYIYMKSVDLNPIPSGLKVTVKGFSYSAGDPLNGFMVSIGDVEGEDRVYSRPTSVDWWGFTPADFDVQYLAPENPPAVCETEFAVEEVASSFEYLVAQMTLQNPSLPEIPSVPEVVKPTEWDGGTSITEPTPDPNCVCSTSYHYIAKAIDTRGSEIAGEIRGLRREVVDLVTGINEFLSTSARQTDASSKRYNDEVKELLSKIEKNGHLLIW